MVLDCFNVILISICILLIVEKFVIVISIIKRVGYNVWYVKNFWYFNNVILLIIFINLMIFINF